MLETLDKMSDLLSLFFVALETQLSGRHPSTDPVSNIHNKMDVEVGTKSLINQGRNDGQMSAATVFEELVQSNQRFLSMIPDCM